MNFLREAFRGGNRYVLRSLEQIGRELDSTEQAA
jgi:hypothetical protein